MRSAPLLAFICYLLMLAIFEASSCDVNDDSNQSLNIFNSDASINTYIKSISLATQTSTNILLENSSVLSLFKVGNGGMNWNSYFSTLTDTSLNNLQTFTTVVVKFRFKSNLALCCMLLSKNITNILEYEVKLVDQNEKYILTAGKNGTFVSDENLYINMTSFNRMNKMRLSVRGVDMIVRKTKLNDVPTNIEIQMFMCKMSNSSTAFAPVYTFFELNNLLCMQDKDCQLMYDPRMMCYYERCICPLGYRLEQRASNYNQVQCAKALTGSILRLPYGCELPHCDLQLFIFMHNNSNQNTLSMHLVTDLHFYLHEYFEMTIKNEKIFKFFIDNHDM
jgi:hypothetical protein